MLSNIELFTQTLNIFNRDEELKCIIPTTNECGHLTVELSDTGEKLCSLCGELLQQNNLVIENISTMNQRRKRDCTIFNCIPSFISEKTRELSIDIYRFVTNNMSTRTMRKEILLACVHRASLICGESVSFDDLVEISGIKPCKLCRGINYVSDGIVKSSQYSTPFFQNDIMIINSLMRNIGLEEQIPYIAEIVKIITKTSIIFNVSHYKSVVCGCIYFWLNINERNISLPNFSKEVNVSHMTIKKKHFEIKVVILRYLLKKIFSNLLNKCIPKYSGRKRSKIPGTLYEPHLKLYVENYKDCNNIKVKNIENKYLPIDDVTDIQQWNILLDTKYFDDVGYEYNLDIKLLINSRDVVFNCTKYDDKNRENGKNIISNTIIDEMATLHDSIN